jgi:hypothetical protein
LRKKKKKGKKAFSKANTEVLAKNLEENDRKEQQAEEKATDVIQRGSRPIEDQAGTKENEAEEWAEYEEKKLDYTNLIQTPLCLTASMCKVYLLSTFK